MARPPLPAPPKVVTRLVEIPAADPGPGPIKGVGRWREWGSPVEPGSSREVTPARMQRPKSLKPVRPNVGFELNYRRRLWGLIDFMHADVRRAIAQAFEMGTIATDAAPPAPLLQAVMRRLANRWNAQFDRLAQDLAAYFVRGAAERADGALESILRKNGFTVPMRLTPAVRDALEAMTAENVSLIKSIASEYLTQIEGHVMRSASVGRDLHQLSRQLQHQYGVTRRRAALIARDQNNKATAVIVRERQNALGVKAIWVHSGGGKTPRPTHVAMSGKEYDPKEGWWDPAVQQRIWPGTLINCRCVSRSVIPGLT